jgi:hypothetical protein
VEVNQRFARRRASVSSSMPSPSRRYVLDVAVELRGCVERRLEVLAPHLEHRVGGARDRASAGARLGEGLLVALGAILTFERR